MIASRRDGIADLPEDQTDRAIGVLEAVVNEHHVFGYTTVARARISLAILKSSEPKKERSALARKLHIDRRTVSFWMRNGFMKWLERIETDIQALRSKSERPPKSRRQITMDEWRWIACHIRPERAGSLERKAAAVQAAARGDPKYSHLQRISSVTILRNSGRLAELIDELDEVEAAAAPKKAPIIEKASSAAENEAHEASTVQARSPVVEPATEPNHHLLELGTRSMLHFYRTQSSTALVVMDDWVDEATLVNFPF